jgi:hypothetical protein
MRAGYQQHERPSSIVVFARNGRNRLVGVLCRLLEQTTTTSTD